MFRKILVANRGEIAIRAMRAAYELGAATVAVYPYEDRNSLHRLKADEAYLIGEEGHPVRAYLDVSEIIRVATESGADAIYPGYGFLSENPDLAQAAAENGITFIGPGSHVLEMAGNKVTAKEHAIAAGVPVLKSTPASNDIEALIKGADEIGFPVFAKAVAGGGGRGMRRVDERDDLREALEAAMREADSAFGDPTMFIEQAVVRPRHIEVQILADSTGETVHLFERDCSVQRRHQKVVEIAPAPNLDEKIRQAMYRDAIAFAKSIGYVNAGTVEFLLDTAGERKGQHVFIEMNPRIQVEHTVTEEVTDVDLVQSQMRIAAGETIAELGLHQKDLKLRGAALQCRITTEDPASGFRPDTGEITTYRSPGGAGIRLDGGTVAGGSQVSPHFDSMLVKMTCRGRDFATAVMRAKRGLAEFRLRGVTTNIPFLQAVLDDPDFVAGDLSTSFIEERPWLVRGHQSKDRGTKILNWLADVTVNQPNGDGAGAIDPAVKLPDVDLEKPAPDGSRQRLLELGPAGFAAALRAQTALAVTDTTFRDAHQSLLATRVRTKDLVAVMPHVARLTPGLLSVEAWGGATYDVALRFLGEDPWERLAAMREALPNIAIQMLLRGRNTVGYTPYPTAVTDAFVAEAASTGVDIFRIFDALNDVDQLKPAVEAVLATGTAVAEVALCYTGNLLDPAEDLYTLDYYLRLADDMVAAGAHILAIKDMAGLLRAGAAETLVGALRERFDLPVHVHTHDTAGGQLATLLAASRAGADAVDVSERPDGRHHEPAEHVGARRGDGAHRPRHRARPAGGQRPRAVLGGRAEGLPAVRVGPRRADRTGVPARDPGRPALQPAPAGDRPRARRPLRGHRGSVRGRQRHPGPPAEGHAVVEGGRRSRPRPGCGRCRPRGLREEPRQVRHPGFGGRLHGGRARRPAGRLARAVPHQGAERPRREDRRRGADARGDRPRCRARPPNVARALNRLLFAGPTQAFEQVREQYGDLSAVETPDYLYGLRPGTEHSVTIGPGVNLFVGLEAIGEADDKGMRTVMATLNGQLRPVFVRDRNITVESKAAEKADATQAGQVAAPFSGVVTLKVAEGDTVEAGQQVASIEAMKMEAAITTPVAGTVARLAIPVTQQVDAGDLLVVVQ